MEAKHSNWLISAMRRKAVISSIRQSICLFYFIHFYFSSRAEEVYYKAPEVITAAPMAIYSYPVDVYSFGLVLWSMAHDGRYWLYFE